MGRRTPSTDDLERAPDAPSGDVHTWVSSPPSGEASRPSRRLFGDRGERYHAEGPIGEGGLGRVEAVHDAVLDRAVARKSLRGDRPGLEQRFVREARITAQLDHPNIVPIYDAGTDDHGRPYYTMKRLEGRSLGDVLAQAGSLAERLALLDRFVAVCQAVAYAHDRAIVHRDLKPDNVVLGGRGETWVVDWGLAEEVGTPSAGVSGTLGWMGPEQARGEPPKPHADVWSLGAMLHALIAGGRPFADSTDTHELLERSRVEAVPPLLGTGGVADELCAIADKALSGDLAVRYPDAGSLVDDLERFQAGRWVEAYAYSPWQVLVRVLQRHRLAVGVTGLVLGSGLVLVAVNEARVRVERDEALAARVAEAEARRGAELALARSLLAQAAISVEGGDLSRAEVLAAEALRHREDPVARGILLRASGAWAPRLRRVVPSPVPCRTVDMLAPDALVCAGPQGAVVLRDGAVSWRHDGVVTRIAVDPGSQRAVVSDGERVFASDLVTGLRSLLADDRDIHYATAWAGRAIWGVGGSITDGTIGPVEVCPSTVGHLEVRGDELLVTCVNAHVVVHDAQTLARRRALKLVAGLSYVSAWVDDEVWSGSGRAVTRVAGGPEVGIDVVGYPWSIAASPDGQWLVVGTDRGEFVVIDRRNHEVIAKMAGHHGPTPVVFDGSGGLWSGGPEGLREWQLPERRWSTLQGVNDAVPSPDRQHLALGLHRGRVQLVDSEGPRPGALLESGRVRVHLAWGEPGLFSASSWGGVDRLDPDGGPASRILRLDGQVDGLTILPSGSLVAALRDPRRVAVIDPDAGTARLSEPAVWEHLLVDDGIWGVRKGRAAPIDAVTLRPGPWLEVDGLPETIRGSPDGRRLAVGTGSGRIVILDAAGVDDPIELPPHGLRAQATFLDDRLVASASWDGSVRLVALTDEGAPELLAELSVNGPRVLGVMPLGDDLVTVDWDQVAKRWDLTHLHTPADVVLHEVRERTGRAYVDGDVRFVGLSDP